MKNIQFYKNQLEEIRNTIGGGLFTLKKSKDTALKALKELSYEINVIENHLIPDLDRKINEIQKELLVKEIFEKGSFLQMFVPKELKKKYLK